MFVNPLSFIKSDGFDSYYFLYASFFMCVYAVIAFFWTYPFFNFLTVVFSFFSSVMIGFWLFLNI